MRRGSCLRRGVGGRLVVIGGGGSGCSESSKSRLLAEQREDLLHDGDGE